MDAQKIIMTGQVKENIVDIVIEFYHKKCLMIIRHIYKMKRRILMDKTDKEVIKILLIKQQEISNRFYETITEVMRLGYETDRGKAKVNDLSESVEYILSDMKRLLNR